VVASHYAEPVEREIAAATELRGSPAENSEAIGTLKAGTAFALLDESLGWAWGYGGEDRRVGYVPVTALR
jgi:hypothetical protein